MQKKNFFKMFHSGNRESCYNSSSKQLTALNAEERNRRKEGRQCGTKARWLSSASSYADLSGCESLYFIQFSRHMYTVAAFKNFLQGDQTSPS